MKNKLKFAAIFFAIIVLISSFCFAEDQAQTPIEPRTSDVEQINVTDGEAVTTNLENEAITTEESDIPEEPEIYEGDLYIFDDTVNMDKLVDGNVYIIGKDVTITGQIAGNLFVVADNLTIGDDTSTSSYNGYVFYNIYAIANKATLYSSCYDLYVAGKDVTIDSSFYLYRDLNLSASNANIFATIGRNANIAAKNLNLKKDDSSSASIYGNLNYSASAEVDGETLENCVYGDANISEDNSSSITLSKVKIFSFILLVIPLIVLLIILVLVVRLIISKTKKKSDETVSQAKVEEKPSEETDKKDGE